MSFVHAGVERNINIVMEL